MDKQISFTQIVKEELTSLSYSSLAKIKSLLSAYVRITGSVIISNKKTYLSLVTENAKTAKFIYEKINEIYHPDIHFNFLKSKSKSKKITYQIEIKSNADDIIEDLGINFLEGKISKNIVYNDQTISGYLAGIFLASGSINSPQTSNYHLELVLNNENYAKWVYKLFFRYRGHKIEPKQTTRRGRYIIYFKKSDQIANFLAMIGASTSCAEYESVRIDRDFVNTTNRLANFDTANMSRTINTAKRQKEEIIYIEEHLGMGRYNSHKCALLAELRKEYESYSMEDLAKLMSEITGQEISKSNVNHLFRNIHDLYISISEKRKKTK